MYTFDFDIMLKQSIDFVDSNLKGKDVFVGFSGGKDSICTAELLKMCGIKHTLYYSFTGIDPPEVVQFIRSNYPECVFLKPKKTFWQSLQNNVVPSGKLRWCCRVLKKEPSYKIPNKIRVFGIRSGESSRRSKYGQVNYKEKIDHTEYYPIYYWKEGHVWDFIEKYDLKYPSLYDDGFGRIGCVICPFHSKRDMILHKKHRDKWPKFFDLFEKEVAKLYKKRVSQGKKMYYDTPEKYVNAWYKNDCARWYAE